MLFNSIDFAVFLPFVFLLYWFTKKNSLNAQNYLILFASYTFYSWWDWRFLSLIIFSTVVDYTIGINLAKHGDDVKRKLLLWVSISVNLGMLGFFKYYNFFLDNFITAFSFFGTEIKANSLNIILPVGISFYTFQTLSYTIDIYKRKLEPTKDFIAFSAFVSFFPQLVAGPIERATNLLPQFYIKRQFNYSKAVDGMRQILWGLFKKIVIADNCAKFSDRIFNDSADMNGSTLVLGAFFFSFQVYADFSGYSDIAIGTSRLFGFNLKQNFAFPYFSRNMAEFWRKWHISLSTWFRDYLYIPLGGSRIGIWKKIRNVFIVFIVSGFWHGANWTYIAWGALNALYILPFHMMKQNKNKISTLQDKTKTPNIKEILSILLTFGLTLFAWIFFRAENIDHALNYINEIFSLSILELPGNFGGSDSLKTISLIIIFMSIEWFGRSNQYALEKIGLKWPMSLRHTFYFTIIVSLFWFSNDARQFLYFQF